MHWSLKNSRLRAPWLFPFFADFAAIVAAYYATYILRFHSDLGETVFETLPALLGTAPGGEIGTAMQFFYIHSAPRIILILTAVLCTLYAIRNLYDERRFLIKRPIAWDVIAASVIALAVFYSYWYLKRNVYHPRSFFASVLMLNVFFCLIFRHALSSLLAWLRDKYDFDRCRAVVIGTPDTVTFITTLLEISHPHGIHTAGRMLLDPATPMETQMASITEALRQYRAELLIFDGEGRTVSDIMHVLKFTQDAGIPTKILSRELSVLVTHANLPCDLIRTVPLVHFNAPSHGGRIGRLRRLLTFVFAGSALIVLAPLMLLVALLVRLSSPGPAVFIQDRIGVNRKPFKLYKFRTMHTQAEEILEEIEVFNDSSGALFKMKHDPRITPIGRILRRFSLDELPQFLNVLKGDMAIVGPRPLPRRDFENYDEEWHYSRHTGLPGLTCLWQISGRSNINFHNMCILDVYYLRNHNWILDLKITLRTIRTVLFGEGAY